MTRRQLLLGLLAGGAWGGAGLLIACGQPEPTARSAGGAGNALTPPVVVTSAPGTPGTPGDLPTPTRMPTSIGTVVLPTAPAGPYPGSDIRTVGTLPAPLPYSTPRPDDPYQLEITRTRDGKPNLSAELSTLIVVAMVSELQSARWGTPDGRRPANPHDRQSPYGIYTPMFVQIEQVAKGAAPTARLAVIVPGGTVGNDYTRYNDGLHDFEAGQRVVLFLKLRGIDPAQLDGLPTWHPNYRYTVTPDGRATNSYETRPLPELLAIIASVAGPTPTPGVTPQRSPSVTTPQRP